MENICTNSKSVGYSLSLNFRGLALLNSTLENVIFRTMREKPLSLTKIDRNCNSKYIILSFLGIKNYTLRNSVLYCASFNKSCL